MKNIETIPFENVLQICGAFISSPSSETQQALEDLKKKIKIRHYLPMQDKIVALYRVVADTNRPIDTASSIFTANMELAFFFDGLLAYTNIESLVTSEVKTYEVYDIFYQSGLADFILQYCSHDYDRLVRLLERSISYENLRQMLDSLESINSTPIQQALSELKGLEKSLDPEVIKNLADIVKFNDPTLYELKDSVIDNALDKLERADRLEKMKEAHE